MTKQRSVAGTVEDPTLKFSTLELGGKTYRLALTYNLIAKAEPMSGCNMLEGLDNLHALSAVHFRGLAYCALHTAHPELTLDDVGDLIGLDPENRLSVIAAVAEAYRLAMPGPRKDPTGAGAPPAED